MCTRKQAVVISIFFALFAFSAVAQNTLPPVIVTGTRIGGGDIICRGDDCASVLADLQNQAKGDMEYEVSLPPDYDVPIDMTKMCAALKASKPANCSYSSPPPSPGISVPGQLAYQPNGCGTGKMANVFADAFLEIATRPTYSGDLQAPYPGVSFRGACNGHDVCWASGNPKSDCDYAFRADMIAACGGDSAANNVCIGFSGLYHGAVTNTGPAQTAYNSSMADRTCALWASDMRENGCQ